MVDEEERVLVVRPGSVYPELRESCGDFDEWIESALSDENLKLTTVDCLNSDVSEEDLRSYGALIITGSLESVYPEERAWIRNLIRLLHVAKGREIPVLGVCFGMQIMAAAFGGAVIRREQGRILGTIEVELTDAGVEDPLFEGITRCFEVQASCGDMVSRLPPEAILLAAGKEGDPMALGVGRWIRGVQFHPEMRVETMKCVVDLRQREAESLGHEKRSDVRVAPSATGIRILGNFVTHFLRKREAASV